jgi:small-conductance mechanosensitive channel
MTGILRFGMALVLLLAAGFVVPERAVAAGASDGQAPEIALPDDLSKPEVRDLISRLSDDQVRALLIRQLDNVAAAQAASNSGAGSMQGLKGLHQRLETMWVAFPEVPLFGNFIVEKLTAGRAPSHLWTVLLLMAAIFAGAGAVEWLFRRLFTRLGQLAHGGEVKSTVDRLCVAGLRIVMDLLAVGVFALAAIVIFFAVYDGHEPTHVAIASVFWAIVFMRIIIAVVRPLLSPDDSVSRLPPLDDKTAQHSFRRAIVVGAMIVVAVQLVSLLKQYGMAAGPMLALVAVVNLVVLGAIIVMIWRDRKTVSAMISPDDADDGAGPSPPREFLAANWHVLASCYILGLWLFGMMARLLTGEGQGGAIIVSLALLPALPIVDWLGRAGIRRLCEGPQEDQDADAAAGETADGGSPDAESAGPVEAEHGPQAPTGSAAQAFEPVLIRNMRVILGLLVILLLAAVWGLDLHNVAAAGMSERVADALFDIVVTLILAWAVWGFVKTAMSYYAPQEQIDVDQMVEGESGGTGLTRVQTLLPLFRKFILIALIVIVTLVILSSLGISIGPLIAGAGVIGLAIGFGAQTLVKDIISGAFFLADDAFRLGEYIDVGMAKGMVERISVRSFRLRHHNGPINTIPFGEVQKVMNYSRDWVMMKLEMRVSSDTDLEKLRKVVKKVGQEMMADPELGPNFLQPLKSQGVNRMDDDGAFLIRVKFMSKPGEQFVLRREVFRRVQEAFAANGIRFAPKRVMVDTQPGSSDSQVAAAVAAAVAAEKPAPS